MNINLACQFLKVSIKLLNRKTTITLFYYLCKGFYDRPENFYLLIFSDYRPRQPPHFYLNQEQ